MRAVTPGSPSERRRATISVAALSVNVTTSTWSTGTTSVAIAYAVRRLMTRSCAYYERSRTHLSWDKDASIPRAVMPPSRGTIVAIPEVGGLHHRYERRAA